MYQRIATLYAKLMERSQELKTGIRLFEIQVLVFPVLVVLLACISFFFGGHCAGWQWWTALAITLALPFWRCSNTKFALYADGSFVAMLALLWCAAPMMYDGAASPDYSLYHLPQIRLLIAGWNPVFDPTAEQITTSLGLSIEGMSYFHVAYLSKVAAIFSAVAFSFIRDPYALTYPIVFFIFAGLALTVMRTFRRAKMVVGLFTLVLIWHWTPSYLYVDAGVELAAAGLLFTMYRCYRERKLEALPLVVFSFWLMNLKMPALIAAFLFWAVFTISYLWRNRTQFSMPFAKISCMAVAMMVLLCITSFSPYGTSFRDTGHPLYPFMSVDEEKYPVRKLTWDFKIGNADYDEMGYWGEFFNAYTVPSFVREYYNCKLNRTDFKPHKYIWDYSFVDTDVMCPLSSRERGCLWLAVIALLVFPSFRIFGAMMLACLFIFPREYMGFWRYQPWLDVFEAMAIVALISYAYEKCSKLYLKRFILFLLLVFCGLQLARGFVAKTAAVCAKHDAIENKITNIYTCYIPPKSRIPLGYESTAGERHAYGGVITGKYVNNFRLLLNSIGKYDVEVNILPDRMTDGFGKTIFGYYIGEVNEQRYNCRTKMIFSCKAWADYFNLLMLRF